MAIRVTNKNLPTNDWKGVLFVVSIATDFRDSVNARCGEVKLHIVNWDCMKEIQAPDAVPAQGPYVFLAGSIEMGAAERWQERVVNGLADTNWVILNPRRDKWDTTIHQGKDDPRFRAQVEWELSGLERADRILLYLSADTKSPISLLELGLFADTGKLIVVCADQFWRAGNVDIVCERYSITQFETLEEGIAELRSLA